MQNTKNYSLLLPDGTDFYNVDDYNANFEAIDTQMKSNQTKADTVTANHNSHVANKSNPHGVTKEQIGLGNVPNVTTNNQTPTYTVPGTAAELVSGETVATAFGKIARAVSSLISHLSNTANPHGVTKAQIGLGSVENTSDANKPISTATQTALNLKRNISDVIPIGNGGTGASTRANANKNLICFASVNSAPATDLPSDYEAGAYIYQESNGSVLPYKPTTYGLLFSIRAGNDITQLWFAQASGAVYKRSGNMVGWNGLVEMPANRGWQMLQTTKTITLQGDVTGSVNLNNVEDAVINVTVADDSHNHIVSNVDGLQTALDSKVDIVSGKGLSTNDYTTTEKNKLAGIAAGAQVNTITGVKGNAETSYRTGQVNITPANIGLGNVNNTADSAKSVLYAATAGGVAWGNVTGKPSTFPAASHTHDDRYYTETEVNNLLEQRVNIGSFANNRLSLQWIDTTSELKAFIDGVDVGTVTIAKG